jgi:hypothetical protein
VVSLTAGLGEHERGRASSGWWLRSRREKLTAPHPTQLWLLARLAAALARSSCSCAWSAFFKGQPQLAQNQPHPSHTQVHLLSLFQLRAQFLQCHMRLSRDLLSDPLLHARRDPAHGSVPPYWRIHLPGARPRAEIFFAQPISSSVPSPSSQAGKNFRHRPFQ